MFSSTSTFYSTQYNKNDSQKTQKKQYSYRTKDTNNLPDTKVLSKLDDIYLSQTLIEYKIALQTLSKYPEVLQEFKKTLDSSRNCVSVQEGTF